MLIQEAIVTDKELEYKFAQLELKKLKFEKEYNDRQAERIERQRQYEEERREKILSNSMAVVEKLSGGRLEPNHSMFFKEVYLNMAKNATNVPATTDISSTGLSVASSSFSSSSFSTPHLNLKGEQLTLAIVASQKGKVLSTPDLIRLGKYLSQKYQDLHGKKPEKHTQLHHGKVISVNTFYKCDRKLIEEAIDELFP